jgi:hypothetical protein
MIARPTKDQLTHLMYDPLQPMPKTAISMLQPDAQIIALVNRGKGFRNDYNNKFLGLAESLQEAMDFAGTDGSVASLPYLVAGKALAGIDNYLWKNAFTALSSENIGIDKRGIYVKPGNAVLITIHGVGVLTPERLGVEDRRNLYSPLAAVYDYEEFDDLCKGRLPNGEFIQIYPIDAVQKGLITDVFGSYGIALDFATARYTTSYFFNKKEFMQNPLVLARVGTLEYLEAYFDKAKEDKELVANFHRLREVVSEIPQYHPLLVLKGCSGLDALSEQAYYNRFVAVQPEVQK